MFELSPSSGKCVIAAFMQYTETIIDMLRLSLWPRGQEGQ